MPGFFCGDIGLIKDLLRLAASYKQALEKPNHKKTTVLNEIREIFYNLFDFAQGGL